jgi:hypothetical protein
MAEDDFAPAGTEDWMAKVTAAPSAATSVIGFKKRINEPKIEGNNSSVS